jgi:hypothetical protein
MRFYQLYLVEGEIVLFGNYSRKLIIVIKHFTLDSKLSLLEIILC